jgi:hypothetical protein
MRQRNRFGSPALIISLIALFVALGGTVYAAKKINGKAIKVKSIPGNRLKPKSVPANRLKPGVLTGAQIAGPITGAQINESTLGRVPMAGHAETADLAHAATDAQTALNAVNAVNAEKVNGHSAGCLPGTQPFAGACWQSKPSELPETAISAAMSCAKQGGTLPSALELSAFAQIGGVGVDAADEWASDIVSFTSDDLFAVATVTSTGIIGSALFNGGGGSALRKFRCVIPLVS